MATGRKNYIGTYRLAKVLSNGQVTAVYEAVRPVDHKHFAIKALQPSARNNKAEIALLKHEYAVGKGMKHPNVIGIYEHSVDGDTPYLVLEFYTTRNMKQAIGEGVDQLAPFAQRIVEQAAQGLAYVHSRGWVHRDIKPDNFLVDEKGSVKLIDLAIARKAQRGLSRLFAGKSKIQGTRSYMSPEQIRGEPLDFRADIYSLGCVFYELVAGKPPYSAGSSDDLLNKHLKAPIQSAMAANDAVMPQFSKLVSRMMAKKAEQRPASLQEFLKEFGEIRVYQNRPRGAAARSAGGRQANG